MTPTATARSLLADVVAIPILCIRPAIRKYRLAYFRVLTPACIEASVGLGHLWFRLAVVQIFWLMVCACLIVDAGFLDHGDEDIIGLPGNGHTLGRHLTNNPDRNTRPRERVPHHEIVVDTELASEFSHLVLEKLPQGLD